MGGLAEQVDSLPGNEPFPRPGTDRDIAPRDTVPTAGVTRLFRDQTDDLIREIRRLITAPPSPNTLHKLVSDRALTSF